MNETETLLTLDLQRRGTPPALRCKKGDTARILRIRLREGPEPYVPEEGAYAVFAAVKSDGGAIFNRCTLKDSDIFYGFTPETTSAVGLMPCEIRLYGGEGQFITSAPFYLHVYPVVYGPQAAEAGKDQQTALDYLVDKTLNLHETLKNKLETGAFQGASAYEIAVQQGFQGTEDQWLRSLQYDHSEEFTALSQQVKAQASQAEKSAVRAEMAADRAEKAAYRAGSPMSWTDWQDLIREGRAGTYLHPGDQFTVDRVKETRAEVLGEGIRSASADPYAFVKARGQVLPGKYSFAYDGKGWTERGNPVDLKPLGITLTGTPQKGDRIFITETAEPVLLDVIGLDYEVPAEKTLTHSLTLMVHDPAVQGRFSENSLLWYCDERACPQGLAPGTYHIRVEKGCYNEEPYHDGLYHFTTTKPIPVGGGIRHTTLGKFQRDGYVDYQVTRGFFETYDEKGQVLERNLRTVMGAAGPCLGTATARDPAVRQGKGMGFLNWQFYGSNDWETSAVRQWLNSDLKEGWFQRLSPWDLPSTLPKAGYLLGLDPAFLRVLGRVRKRTCCLKTLYPLRYRDTEELVFLPGTTELGFGPNVGESPGQVESVFESPVGPEGSKAEPYPVFHSNADRIRYSEGAPILWWQRGSYYIGGDNVCNTDPDGSLGYAYAGFTCGIVPCFCIV